MKPTASSTPKEMCISVVLTTHNRPELLLESVASVVSQTYPNWDLVIVDDGSALPVTLESVEGSELADKIRVVRHPTAKGLSAARNTGMGAAKGDFVTFLDDDDLLAPDGLRKIVEILVRHQEIDCLFLNIEPFGPLAAGSRENQEDSLARTLADLGGNMDTNLWVIPNSRALFVALLHRLPMAFQRPVIRRSLLLSKVGRYEGQKFGDLEWNYRAALRCHCAVLLDRVSLFRCEGQSYFSNVDAKSRMLDALIKIRQSLLSLPEVRAEAVLSSAVQRALSAAYFERSYVAYLSGIRFPWRDFARSLSSGISWRHVSLLARMPKRLIQLWGRARSGAGDIK